MGQISVTNVIDFTQSANFTIDAATTQINGSGASLKEISVPGKTFNAALTSGAAYTYDATKAEFISNILRQKDQRPNGWLFFATYATVVNGDWGKGSLTATNYGNVPIAGAYLDAEGYGGKYLTYPAASNAPGQTGTIRTIFNPQFSGHPNDKIGIFVFSKTTVDSTDLCQITIGTDGSLTIQINDDGNNPIINYNIPYSWTANTDYEIELNYDLILGATRLFINGSQVGVTQTGTGTRTATNVGYFAVADYVGGSNYAKQMYKDFLVCGAVQHTANYTPGAVIPTTNFFLASSVIFPAFISPYGVGAIQSLSAFSVTADSSVKYTVNGKYWNGVAWTTSSGQANTAAEINSNIPTLSPIGTSIIFTAYFTTGNSQETLSALSQGYTGQEYPVSSPSVMPNGTANNITTNELFSLAAIDTISSNEGINLVVLVNGVPYWYNGSSWVVSSSANESNNVTSLTPSILTALNISTGAVINFGVYLISDGVSSPAISSMSISSSFWVQDTDILTKCVVYGYCLDEQGAGISGVTVAAILNASMIYKTESIIMPVLIQTTSDSGGYWELKLVESATAGKTYTFYIGGTPFVKTVPASVSAAFNSL